MCPIDITLEVDESCQLEIPDFTVDTKVIDNCTLESDVVLTQSPLPTSVLTGHNTSQIITITADDGNGNMSVCNFILTLQDATAPALFCPENQILTVNNSCEIALPNYTSSTIPTDNLSLIHI